MTDIASTDLAAIAAIHQVKARYFRGVDLCDGNLVRSVLTENCELDYRGCCVDPITGTDHLPAMNVVIRGRSSWSAAGLSALGIVSVHQGFTPDIVVTDTDHATAVWSMTDRLWMPPTSPYRLLTGHGFYHETYHREDGHWRIATLRIARIRIDPS